MYQHITRYQEVMRENDIAVSVLRLPQNLTLFTQYWSRNGYSYAVIPADGKPGVVVPIAEEMDTRQAGLDHVYVYDDIDMEAEDTDTQIKKIFSKLAKEYGITADSKIGLELDYDVIAPCLCSGKVSLVGEKVKKLVAEGFGSSQFVTVKHLITDVMAIKNESDIEKLKIVNELAAQAMDKFEELVNVPGITEVEVVYEVEKYLQIKARDYKGAKACRAWGQLSTGKKGEIAACDGVVSDARVLEKGDCCLYEMGVSVDGYWADVTRSAVVGGPEGKTQEMMDLVEKSFQAGVNAVKPGATGRDIDVATRKVMEDAGYAKYYQNPAGHGVGFSYHEPIPELGPTSDAVLKENMVIAIEPALYVPGIGGLRKELNVLVTKDGGVILGW